VKDEAADRAAGLVRRCRTAALGTLRGGAPSVSMVPYAIVADPFSFVILVSSLAAHTKDLQASGEVGLMIVEPEGGAQPPHTLARVSMRGKAAPIVQDDPRYPAARSAYAARFPDMTNLFYLRDFAFFAIAPTEVRVVTGFAQAASISPEALEHAVRENG